MSHIDVDLCAGVALTSPQEIQSPRPEQGTMQEFHHHEESLHMTPELSEWRIVWNLAKQVCQRVTRRVIRNLQKLDSGLQAGDDSGLTNAWEEICVQVQGQESVMWDAFDLTVRQSVSREVAELLPYEREAIWLQTPSGEGWDAEDEESRDEYPVVVDEIVDYLTNKYIYSAAGEWSNRHIRKYVEQSSRMD
jgi:hypothetical protein